MINTQLPVFFNTHLHKKLGPTLLDDIKAKLDDPEEKKWIHHLIYLSIESPAGQLFKMLKDDSDIDFTQVLDKSTDISNLEKKELRKEVEGLYGKIVYDYYRENKFDESEIENKRADVYLEEAANLIENIQKKSFKNWIKVFDGIIESAQLEKSPNKIKIGKKDPKPVFIEVGNGQRENEDSLKRKFGQTFNKFMMSHFAFIPLKEKIETLNGLFKKIKKLDTTDYLKKYMLIHFYDLVYAISITSNFVEFSEAQKILICE